MKKALILAGGLPQISLINILKERGYYILLADWNDNPVAKKYCDKYFKVSTLDIEAIRNIAEKEKVEFVTTVCTDQALCTVAKVSQDLSLPCYIDYQTALNVTNKQYMKQVLVSNNIPTAKYLVVDNYDENDFLNFSFPLIVKPVDCNSSKGVKKVINNAQLKDAIRSAVDFSRTNTAVVEDFIEGYEISVDAMIIDNKATVLNTSFLEKIPDEDKFVIFRSISPAIKEQATFNKIEKICGQIATAFNLQNSPLLVQMIIKDGEPYVLEFSARTGGGEKFITIKEIANYDVIKAVVDITEGKKADKIEVDFVDTFFASEFIYCFPGTFDHSENVDMLTKNGIISNFMQFKWKGAVFNSVANSGDRVAGFIIKGKNSEELNRKHNLVLKNLHIFDVNGNDMMRRDLLPQFSLNY